MNRTSKIFWPVIVTPKNAVIKNWEATSRSQKLMIDLGLIKSAANGTYQVLPLAQRALDKCIDLLNFHMRSIGGQKVSLPALTAVNLWEKSGRLDGDITEFYVVRDRHDKKHVLSPTHEEAITALLAESAPISYRQLPLRLYQIGPKFRDELKARFGLLRAKEFLMKDMYTFDETMSDAYNTYNQINQCYIAILKKFQVPFVKVEAESGMMGGNMSHEYHFIANTGEDKLIVCHSCNYAANKELVNRFHEKCPRCKSAKLLEMRGIEIAHSFLLGDKYSKPLGAMYLPPNGKPEHMMMGCYGIGITRLVAAALEVLSTDQLLRWPTLLSPFDICVIGPKEGSKQQHVGDEIEKTLCTSLMEILTPDDILLDDRKYLTIGKRLLDAKRMGYPLIVVIGSKVLEDVPILELHIGEQLIELAPGDIIKEVGKYYARKRSLWESVENNESMNSKSEVFDYH